MYYFVTFIKNEGTNDNRTRQDQDSESKTSNTEETEKKGKVNFTGDGSPKKDKSPSISKKDTSPSSSKKDKSPSESKKHAVTSKGSEPNLRNPESRTTLSNRSDLTIDGAESLEEDKTQKKRKFSQDENIKDKTSPTKEGKSSPHSERVKSPKKSGYKRNSPVHRGDRRRSPPGSDYSYSTDKKQPKRKSPPERDNDSDRKQEKRKRNSKDDDGTNKYPDRPSRTKCRHDCTCQNPPNHSNEGEKLVFCIPCKGDKDCENTKITYVSASTDDIKPLRPMRYCCFVESDVKKERLPKNSMNRNLPAHASKSDATRRGPRNDDLLDIFNPRTQSQDDPFPLKTICQARHADIIDVNRSRKAATRRVPAGYNAIEEKHYSIEPIRERPTNLSKIDVACRDLQGANSYSLSNTDGGEDEDKLFLLSMLPTLKKLSEPVKMDVKIEIMQIMQRSYSSHYNNISCMDMTNH